MSDGPNTQRRMAYQDSTIRKAAREIEQHNEARRSRGRPATPPPPPETLAFFIADDDAELDRRMRAYALAVGPRTPNNKRHARARLYSDLIEHFVVLRKNGITLPRGKSLSLKACGFKFPEILREHRYLAPAEDDEALACSARRKAIAKRLARVFEHIAAAIDEVFPE